MATEQDIEVIEDNDPIVLFTCRVDGTPVNLTGAEVSFYLKATKATEEADTGVVEYSTDNGAITLEPQSGTTLGQLKVQMSRTDIAAPAKKRYRLDVTQSMKKLTYAFGRVIVKDV